MHEFPKSIQEPDSEQQLFDKLSMDKYELEMLEYIRRDMRALWLLEQRQQNVNKNTEG